METIDPRVNAVRSDLADAALEGRITAARFVTGAEMRVVAPVAPLRHAPSNGATLLTEALFGERVTVFEMRADGWVWAQLDDDRYVGWMPHEALDSHGPEATHRVSALRTFAFAEPDIKSPPVLALPFGARVAVAGRAEDRNARYGLIAPRGAVVMQHLEPVGTFEPDWTAVAERFLGVPYLWGGKTSLGLDCSGLVQVALRACGIPAPRDTDMQEREVGTALPAGAMSTELRRGDLVFWKGHVGLMRDRETLIHANAHHMAVASEPLAAATERAEGKGSRVTAVKRPG